MDNRVTEMSTHMFQVLVEQTLAGIYIIQEGLFRYVNPQFAKMFGYASPEEIINRVPMSELIAAEDADMVRERVRQRADGEVEEMRYCFAARRRDGSRMHVEVHGSTSTYEEKPAVMGLLIDVTERFEAEQRIRRRDAKIKALFDGNIIGVLCWDASGQIRDANQAFLDMLGLPPATLGRRRLHWQTIVAPEHVELSRTHIDEILCDGCGQPVRKLFLHSQGHRIPTLVNGIRLEGSEHAGISFVLDLTPIQHAERERDLLADIIQRAPAIMFAQDVAGRYSYINREGYLRTGKPEGWLLGKTDADFMDAATAARLKADRLRIMAEGRVSDYEEEVRLTGTDAPFYFRTTKWPLYDDEGKAAGIAGFTVEITAQKTVEAELARTNNLIQAVFEQLPLMVVLKDLDGRITNCNTLFERTHGLEPRMAIGKYIWEVLPQLPEEMVRRTDREVITTGVPHVEESSFVINGRPLFFLLNLFPVRNAGGEVSGLCAFVQDLSGVKQAERDRVARAEAEYHALHDSLTGLPNRKLLMDRIAQQLLQARREQSRFVVCFIDLDQFKEVNDSLGHEAGDELLRIMSQRMASCIRESDTLARLGGDEFVALLRGEPGATDTLAVIARFRAVVSQPVRLSRNELTISCSIGYAVYPEDGSDVATLLARSDAAMYADKHADKHADKRPGLPENGWE